MSKFSEKYSNKESITEKQRLRIQKKIDKIQGIIAQKTDELNVLNETLLIPIKQKKEN